jgi:hypothetical protein
VALHDSDIVSYVVPQHAIEDSETLFPLFLFGDIADDEHCTTERCFLRVDRGRPDPHVMHGPVLVRVLGFDSVEFLATLESTKKSVRRFGMLVEDPWIRLPAHFVSAPPKHFFGTIVPDLDVAPIVDDEYRHRGGFDDRSESGEEALDRCRKDINFGPGIDLFVQDGDER